MLYGQRIQIWISPGCDLENRLIFRWQISRLLRSVEAVIPLAFLSDYLFGGFRFFLKGLLRAVALSLGSLFGCFQNILSRQNNGCHAITHVARAPSLNGNRAC